MTRATQGTDHLWIIMMKAMRALTRYAAAGIEETGLGLSDFGVLELLLRKGPLPVNTIGPMVDLTPGSISIAVDRLVSKGLVSRVESAEDRRVRIVALTPRDKDLIVSAFRKHSGQMKRLLSELSPEEIRGLEVKLKKVGKRAVLTTQRARAWFKRSPLPGAPSSVVSRSLSSQPLLPPSHVADAPFVAILDPVLTVPERGFARHGQFNTRNNFKRIRICCGEGG